MATTPTERKAPPGFDPACIHTKPTEPPTHEEIAQLAYAIWEARTVLGADGDALSDWYEAEDWLTFWKSIQAGGA